MAKFTFEDILYSRKKKTEEFDFDKLIGPGIYNLFYESDLQKLYNIATSIKYSAELKKKYSAINEILKPRGFAHFHRGTNRVVYKHYENPNILVKVPIDLAGCSDGIMEFRNQNLLKPFVTKVFDVHPSGVSVHERVMPITTYAEFAMFAYDYFQLVSHIFLGRYVMDDIGEGSFMNWGFRYGFGLVLLDFPYLYELDYQRLLCRKILPTTGEICCGEIDYDDGFNHLICKKCGSTYDAKNIGKFIQNYEVNVIKKEDNEMAMFKRKFTLARGNEVVSEFGKNEMESNVIVPREEFKKVDRIRKNFSNEKKIETKPTDTNPFSVENYYNTPAFKPQAHKFVSKKEMQSKQENKLVNNEVQEKPQEQQEEISLVEKYIIGEQQDTPTEKINEEEYQDVDVDVEEEPTANVQEKEEDAPNDSRFQNDESESEQIPEEPIQVESEEVNENNNQNKDLKTLIAELSSEYKLETNILEHLSNIIMMGTTIDRINDMIREHASREFPTKEEADEKHSQYMEAIHKLNDYIKLEQAKTQDSSKSVSDDPRQYVENDVKEHKEYSSDSATIVTHDVYESYYNMINDWFKQDIDPRGGLPGIAKDEPEVSFDMICAGLKRSIDDVLKEEYGNEGQPPMIANKDTFIDKIVQKAIFSNLNYIKKWADING